MIQILRTVAILKKIRAANKRDSESFVEDERDARLRKDQTVLILLFINLVLTNLTYPIRRIVKAVESDGNNAGSDIVLLVWEFGLILDLVIIWFSQSQFQCNVPLPACCKRNESVYAYPMMRAGTSTEFFNFGICL